MGHGQARDDGSSQERTRPDVSATVVHFETPQLLTRCLAALTASSGVRLEAIVVDNASAGFDVAALGAEFPTVTFISNPTNAGFAAASNIGLRRAAGRYVLLLNPDTVVVPDTLARMVDYMDERPDVGCATARLVTQDGRLDLACRRAFPTPARSFYRLALLSRLFPRSRRFGQYNLTYLDENDEAEIDSPCGAFMMVRREVVEQVGLLDERYFMYGEDLDWAYRIKQAGWRIMYTPITTVTHIKRASSRHNRERTIRAFYEAMRIFYRTHYQGQYSRPVDLAVYAAIRLREMLELTSARISQRHART